MCLVIDSIPFENNNNDGNMIKWIELETQEEIMLNKRCVLFMDGWTFWGEMKFNLSEAELFEMIFFLQKNHQ